ncbi:uncharacterized protein METZ01_LOCUS172893, partial [marine metagenome]
MLYGCYGLGGTAGKTFSEGLNLLHEAVHRKNLVQQAQSVGFFRPDTIACHHQLHCLGSTNQP